MAEDHDTMPDIAVIPGRLVPTAWAIECPACKELIQDLAEEVVEGQENEYGPRPEDKFVLCDCGVLIEVPGVQITTTHWSCWDDGK